MQAQAGTSVWEFLFFWLFTGSGLVGLPPGDRDAALMKAVPPQSLAYFEWAAAGPGTPGATGIDGFAADPEIQQFVQQLTAAINKSDAPTPKPEGTEPAETDPEQHSDLPLITKLIASHPGCFFAGYEPLPANQNPLGNWFKLLTGIHGGVILSSGDDSDQLWTSLINCLKTVPGFEFDAASPTQSIPLHLPGYKLIMHREANRIIFALGEGTLPRITEGLTGRLPGIETNARFTAALQRVSVQRVSSIAWFDGKGTVSSAVAAMGPLGALFRPLLTMTAVDAIDHVATTSGVENGTMKQRTLIVTGGRTDGILVVAAGQPIQPQQFAHIPADADMVVATSLNLNTLFRQTRQVLAQTQPLSVRVFDEAVKQLEAELELKIVDDVLPAFGDVISAFDSPAAGGMVASSLVVAIEIRDLEKATIVFNRVLKLVEQSLNPTEQALRQQPFLNQTVFYVHSNGGGDANESPLTPSFCLTDRHLLFAIHPQAMKAQLRFLASRQRGFDPQLGGKLPVPAGDVLTYAYLNGQRANGLMATALPFIGRTLVGHLETEGILIDSFSIPSAAAITPYFGDSTALITRQQDGLLIETQNAPPVIASLALLSAYMNWKTADHEYFEEARRRKNGEGQAVLGQAGDEVVPAVAETKPAVPDESTPSAYRKMGSVLLRALIPDEIKQAIPEETFKRLEEGPSPATLQRREEARKRREERRRRRAEPLAPVPPPR